ncbi:O-antigen ligase [Rhodoblastus sp. 17X3]|uniref:O-antigen ligase family protein n=1 Tax=Rhodoblastus sp. 17X3 TaxID=3047026 RepID=UPI0024B65E29|nr:O-antigen ligase [Rhodoblastus sp. 17X3]MDI9848771.1 O-antigen ligase [Rhodoblastus sp. 17X3]
MTARTPKQTRMRPERPDAMAASPSSRARRGQSPAFVSFAGAFRHSSTKLDLTMGPTEKLILSALFVAIYIAYASLGRDVIFNKTYVQRGAEVSDPIGAALPYVRLLVCMLVMAGLGLRMGFGWLVGRIPALFAPFALLALASAAWSTETRTVLISASGLLFLWMALPALSLRLGIVQVTRLTLLIIAWVLIFSLLLAVFAPSIGIHTGTEAYQSSHAGRWRGIFAHKNALGFWASFGSVLLFSGRGLFTGYEKWVATLGGLAGIVCLIFAKSSTSIVIAFFLVVAVGIIHLLKVFSPTLVMLISIFCAALFGAIFYVGADTIFALLERDATLTGRTELWGLAVDFIQQRPWLGGGYQNLGGQEFRDYTFKMANEELGPENGYLGIWLDLGIFGLIFFLIPLFFGIRNAANWIPHVAGKERLALETMFLIVIATSIQSMVDATALIATGYDGVIAFSAFFMFMAIQKSPLDVARAEAKLAKSWKKKRERLALDREHGRRLALDPPASDRSSGDAFPG